MRIGAQWGLLITQQNFSKGQGNPYLQYLVVLVMVAP